MTKKTEFEMSPEDRAKYEAALARGYTKIIPGPGGTFIHQQVKPRASRRTQKQEARDAYVASNPRLNRAYVAMEAKEKSREAILDRVAACHNGGDIAGANAAREELKAWEKADAERHKLLKAEIRDAQLNPSGPPLVVLQ